MGAGERINIPSGESTCGEAGGGVKGALGVGDEDCGGGVVGVAGWRILGTNAILGGKEVEPFTKSRR